MIPEDCVYEDSDYPDMPNYGRYSMDLVEEMEQWEQIPFLFPNKEISLENLKRFANTDYFPLMANVIDDEKIRLEYWRDHIFVRIHKSINEDIWAVYFQQNQDFAIVADNESDFAVQFHRIDEEDWYYVTPEDFPDAYEFFRQQWEYLMWEYSKIVHYRKLYLQDVTLEKYKAVFERPLVKKYASEYLNENSILYFGDYSLQVRPETADNCSRLTLNGKGKYDPNGVWQPSFYHFEYDQSEDKIRLYTQDGNGYEFEPYEVSYNDTHTYDAARQHFNLIDIWLTEYAIKTGTGKVIYPENLDENGEEV